MNVVSTQRIVWQKAYTQHVLYQGLPFPSRSIFSMDATELERSVRRALRLGAFWLSADARPREYIEFQAAHGVAVSKLCFLPGRGDRYLVTVSQGIWSLISVWDIVQMKENGSNIARATYSPKRMLLSGLVVNSDPDSEGAIAIAVLENTKQRIDILSFSGSRGDGNELQPICTVDTPHRPVALDGDVIIFCDDSSETVVMNWRLGTAALLLSESESDKPSQMQSNRCLQVVTTRGDILVVRARSMDFFPEPQLRSASESSLPYRPLASHSFGWIDGVSVELQTRIPDAQSDEALEPISILLRTEIDDPWSSQPCTLDLFALQPNPAWTSDTETQTVPFDAASDSLPTPFISPYIFPPVHSSISVPTERGALRCSDVILRPYGTAIWIKPRPRSTDLTTFDVHASATQAPARPKPSETLLASVFPGPLRSCHPDVPTEKAIWNRQLEEEREWAAMDYDEALGRVALGGGQGKVTVLDLCQW
ncbi:hypothetical protein CERSUDRAFT_125106 [Gelatoporia subvermispora B]|uniref:Uncharacterized protein n=1 Tax=Ceriporiopsis subvermispora (strain B) TaxID=914234 RepID=M2R8V0_CERS8|nr:hypothetical protein CERSUDRAFT_125106 [Gelatoporia subvermispora B]